MRIKLSKIGTIKKSSVGKTIDGMLKHFKKYENIIKMNKNKKPLICALPLLDRWKLKNASIEYYTKIENGHTSVERIILNKIDFQKLKEKISSDIEKELSWLYKNLKDPVDVLRTKDKIITNIRYRFGEKK